MKKPKPCPRETPSSIFTQPHLNHNKFTLLSCISHTFGFSQMALDKKKNNVLEFKCLCIISKFDPLSSNTIMAPKRTKIEEINYNFTKEDTNISIHILTYS